MRLRRRRAPSRRARALSLLAAACSLLSAACGSENDGGGDGFPILDARDEAPEVTVEAPRPPGCDDNPLLAICQGPGDPADAPEVEREAAFQTPVVTGKYVWTANPSSGRVAVIDAETFEIRAAEAGFLPTHVAALESTEAASRAIVINVGGDDATLLSLVAGQGIQTANVPLHQGADSWSVSPDGRFAIAWTDARRATQLDPTDGFQDVTVVEVTAGAAPVATRLTVGYRPSAFYFDAAGARAFGVTEDGISVIELETGAARLSRLVSLPRVAGRLPDVSVTPDGSRALARVAGSSTLFDVDLATGTTRELDLGAPITDLDLSADGSRLVAVLREVAIAAEPVGDEDRDAGAAGDAGSVAAGPGDAGVLDAGDSGVLDAGAPPEVVDPPPSVLVSQAIFIPVPEGLADASLRETLGRPGERFGSVSLSPDGRRAVLFTTSGSGRMTLVHEDREPRSVDLIASVRAVFVTPDGSHALALQDPAPGSVRKGAFSVISLDAVRAPKLVASDAPAEAVALSPVTPDRALVTVSDPAERVFGTFLVRMPNLQVDSSTLSSRPMATGVVPVAGKAFVAQEHPEGRITFIDLSGGDQREITGFELASKVVSE